MNEPLEPEETVCEECDNTGTVYKRVDVDAEKAIPCRCWRGQSDE